MRSGKRFSNGYFKIQKKIMNYLFYLFPASKKTPFHTHNDVKNGEQFETIFPSEKASFKTIY